MKPNRHSEQLRRLIAIEAARIMIDSGVRDFQMAKRKAAIQHGVSGDEAALPSNAEIDAALREHQALFDADQPDTLRRLRETAADAMRHFARFDARLVGAVLDGSADDHSSINLHLFADAETDVLVFLLDQGIDFREDSRRLRYSANDVREQPVLRFATDGQAFDLTVFDRDDVRQAPLDRVGNKPMRRANLKTVLALIDGVNQA